MLWKTAILTILFGSLNAVATVDMKNANFTDDWVDLKFPSTGFNLSVERTYNSRVLYNGMFGFGWCTDLEQKLEKMDSGAIQISSCGPYSAAVFYPAGVDKKEMLQFVGKLADAHVKAGNKLSKKALSTLKNALYDDRIKRDEFAAKYKVAIPSSKTRKFVNSAADKDSITITKSGNYVRVRSDDVKEIYDNKGNLVEKRDTNGNFLKYSYRANALIQITNQLSQRLSFLYHANGKVSKITGPSDLVVEYKYKKSDLIWVKNAWKNQYTYELDNLHNLTKITYPDKTTREIKYNTKKDWVVAFKDREGCVENYDIDLKSDDHYSTTLVKKCGKKVTNRSKFEFWYKTTAKRGSRLARVRTEINGRVRDVKYHPEISRPIVEIDGNRKTTFSYYESGLVKTKTENGIRSLFKYDNRTGKVSTVVRGKLKSDFKYDGKGNLIFASNSNGQKVKLQYDRSGRIVKLVDHAKRIVEIQYNSKIGKPSVVTRPGLGSIVVKYDRSGNIQKVDSKAGPSVAVQVASAFNNLLEIVKPAGVELGI